MMLHERRISHRRRRDYGHPSTVMEPTSLFVNTFRGLGLDVCRKTDVEYSVYLLPWGERCRLPVMGECRGIMTDRTLFHNDFFYINQLTHLFTYLLSQYDSFSRQIHLFVVVVPVGPR